MNPTLASWGFFPQKLGISITLSSGHKTLGATALSESGVVFIES